MNIIFILLDDLGWNDVGIHNPKVKTPNLIEFSKNSCELNSNHTFSVCGPTRAMIQTGMYSFCYGFQNLIPPDRDYGLDENLKILPSYLKEMQYNTYAIGKWHLGHNQLKWHPYKRGYDYHYGNLTGCISHYAHLNCPTNIHDFSENGKKIKPEGHSCDLLTNKTIEIIHENKDKKFFIYLAYNSPHVPLECPKEFLEYYKNTNNPKKSYHAMISHLDYNLGKIFKELNDLNIMDQTLIWIQSDNGGWTPDWAAGDNFPLKGGKASFYEGGIRSFSLVKHKQIKIKNYDGLCHSVDFLPTILDFCEYKNLENLENLDGISLKKDLVENENKNKNRDLVIGYYNENYWCFIIDGQYKIINENKAIECYDILNNPNETNRIKIPQKIQDKIKNLIEECSKKRIFEPNPTSLNKIKNVKFWGELKNNIKILKDKNYKKIRFKKNSTFLNLCGYDVFYK